MGETRFELVVIDLRTALERKDKRHADAFEQLLIEAELLWKCPTCPGNVVRYAHEKRCVACDTRKPLKAGELSDEKLEELGVEDDYAIFDFDAETLGWMSGLVSQAQQEPASDEAAELFANPFAKLGVYDVRLTVANTAEGPELELSFAIEDGFRIASQKLDPETLIGQQLDGFDLARHIVRVCYELVDATKDDFFENFNKVRG